ncbi:SRPBCC domain-containing protein [Microbacterium sp.]|uniref:SRPBCC domain-containing protein n=1 Tax=Microbacterium sp. TaxID=51671 RepID=UPI0027343E60|nr:SRPBCC domain-containing protein [Microbacterium sp.]MDP3951687.1 SRPBCC domain-containing protein [Microbacterium sp.]
MTENPASVVDEASFTVRRSIRINAPVEKVWQAVTQPEHISRWFGRTVLDGVGVGAAGTMTFPDYGSIPLRVEEWDEPRRVAYRWSNDDALGELPKDIQEKGSTVFTFTLNEADGGTQLTVVESGFENTSAPLANLESHRTGWDEELDKLVRLVEKDAAEKDAVGKDTAGGGA